MESLSGLSDLSLYYEHDYSTIDMLDYRETIWLCIETMSNIQCFFTIFV